MRLIPRLRKRAKSVQCRLDPDLQRKIRKAGAVERDHDREQALQRIAIDQEDPDLVDEIMRNCRWLSRRYALLMIAIRTDDLELARRLWLSYEGSDYAFSSIAIKRADPDLARQLGNPSRDFALREVAIKLGDTDLAREVEYEPSRNYALYRIAVEQNDIELARTFKNPTRDRLFEQIAIALGDRDLAQEIERDGTRNYVLHVLSEREPCAA
jgi:hypothetical protein